jgi:hypothetical protein
MQATSKPSRHSSDKVQAKGITSDSNATRARRTCSSVTESTPSSTTPNAVPAGMPHPASGCVRLLSWQCLPPGVEPRRVQTRATQETGRVADTTAWRVQPQRHTTPRSKRAARSEVRNMRPATNSRPDDPPRPEAAQPPPENAGARVRGKGRQARGTSLDTATYRDQRTRHATQWEQERPRGPGGRESTPGP